MNKTDKSLKQNKSRKKLRKVNIKEKENISTYPTNIKHVTRAVINNYTPIIWYFRLKGQTLENTNLTQEKIENLNIPLSMKGPDNFS